MSVNEKRVLMLVDDDQPLLNLVELHLSEKFEILIANDGHEMLEKLKQKIPDIILLDVMMPKIDGYEACRSLKSNSQFQNIPVIMLTAKGTEEDIQKGKSCGADSYLTKPFDFDELVEVINNFEK